MRWTHYRITLSRPRDYFLMSFRVQSTTNAILHVWIDIARRNHLAIDIERID